MSKNNEEIMSLLFSVGRQLKQSKGKNEICNFLHLETLRFIADRSAVTMKAVADFLSVTPPSATVLVNNLVAAKYVERVPNKEDRRTINISLTKKGETALKESIEQRARRLKKLLDRLSASEQKTLCNLLRKMTNF